MVLEGIPVVGLTAPGLLGLVVLLLLLGKIVPRATYLDKSEEANRWREAYEKEREARATSEAQTKELLEVGRTNLALLKALFHNSEHIRASGESDVSQT